MIDVNKIRKDFPILSKTINGKPLIYFDNGATTQKPKAVIDAIVKYYSEQNANIHRGVHTLSREATILFEAARNMVSHFINAAEDELIFTAGTTDGINLVASGLNLPEGSEIIVMEKRIVKILKVIIIYKMIYKMMVIYKYFVHNVKINVIIQ